MSELKGNHIGSSRDLGAVLVSVIIPVHNEETQIERCLQCAYSGFGLSAKEKDRGTDANRVFSASDIEFIVVDARSDDGTPAVIEALRNDAITKGFSLSCVRAPKGGRAQQMNYGAAKAAGQVLVFLHADTRLCSGFGVELKQFLRQDRAWGFCRVSFDKLSWEYRMLCFMINFRSSLFSISTGDQTQFVKTDSFESVAGFPDQPLMEDLELSKSLKAVSKPYVLNSVVTTSSRKWHTEGFWGTVILMWKLRFSYWRGATPESIHRRYYRSN